MAESTMSGEEFNRAVHAAVHATLDLYAEVYSLLEELNRIGPVRTVVPKTASGKLPEWMGRLYAANGELGGDETDDDEADEGDADEVEAPPRQKGPLVLSRKTRLAFALVRVYRDTARSEVEPTLVYGHLVGPRLAGAPEAHTDLLVRAGRMRRIFSSLETLRPEPMEHRIGVPVYGPNNKTKLGEQLAFQRAWAKHEPLYKLAGQRDLANIIAELRADTEPVGS